VPKGVHFWAVVGTLYGSRNKLAVVDEAVIWKFQVALDPGWSRHKVNLTTKLVGD
jgi:hypothetical protein